MLRDSHAASRCLRWGRAAATVALWVLILVYLHRLGHQYREQIEASLQSAILRLLATTIAITGLLYFIACSLPAVPRPGPRVIATAFVWTLLLSAGHGLSHMGLHEAQATLDAMRQAVGPVALLLLALAYAAALALPFVPGVELGLLIMAVFGLPGVVVTYAATVGGLCAAHALGRMLPEPYILRVLAKIGVDVPHDDIAGAVGHMLARSRNARTAASRLGSILLRYRYLGLAVCLNFPGNAIAGGGGGLALLSGMSRQFTWARYVVTVAVATLPLPVIFFGGWISLDPFLHHYGFLHDTLTWIERLITGD